MYQYRFFRYYLIGHCLRGANAPQALVSAFLPELPMRQDCQIHPRTSRFDPSLAYRSQATKILPLSGANL